MSLRLLLPLVRAVGCPALPIDEVRYFFLSSKKHKKTNTNRLPSSTSRATREETFVRDDML